MEDREKKEKKSMRMLTEPRPKGFLKYVKKHRRTLEELESELSGSNFDRPRQTDYSEYLEDEGDS